MAHFTTNFRTLDKMLSTILTRSKCGNLLLVRFKIHTKSIQQVPGPKPWPLIGHSHLFGPFGPYKMEKINDAAMDLCKQYGPIVHLKLGLDFIFLFDPDAIANVFRNEPKFPVRPLFDALLHYRKRKPEKYLRMGMFTENGNDWFYLRSLVNPLLRPGATEPYLPPQSQVADDFVTYLKVHCDSQGQVKNVLEDLYKYTQEAVGVICFGKRLNCFGDNERSAQLINKAVSETLAAMGKTLLGLPLWKIFPTTTYRTLVRSQNNLRNVTENLLMEARQRLGKNPSEQEKNPFLTSLLKREDLDERDLTVTVLEMFQAGIDATASTLGMTMYHLGQNITVQDRLIAEIDSLGPITEPITFKTLSRLKYLRACLKETFRLTPPAGGSARILGSPLVLCGYEIPSGTVVIGSHPVMSRSESLVPNPNKYDPERWLRTEDQKKPTVPPFVSLPFGFGTRMCPGRQIAEQESALFLIKLLQRFRLLYNGEEVSTVMRLNYMPDKPLNFTLTERKEGKHQP